MRLCSHVPSRLEGMETLLDLRDNQPNLAFTRTFPFGGNGNRVESPLVNCFTLDVHTYLPVWREWKPYFSEFCHCFAPLVHTYLPVWREWKPIAKTLKVPVKYGSHVPSRLEGMETHIESKSVASRSVTMFTRTFPFGGNGNMINANIAVEQ